MHTFFFDKIENNKVLLSEIDSKHAVKVLRLTQGTTIRLINGKGTEAFGEISIPHHKSCEISIHSVKEFDRDSKEIIIALSPTKSNDRTEWFLEKATEIGFTKFVPIICNNSERKKFNTDRWVKIVTSAMKQSQRVWMPIIEDPINFKDFVEQSKPDLSFIAHCEDEQKNNLTTLADASKDQLIMIGPEGDFSSLEIKTALEKGFTPVSIGDNRLRTETAGIASCTLMKFTARN